MKKVVLLAGLLISTGAGARTCEEVDRYSTRFWQETTFMQCVDVGIQKCKAPKLNLQSMVLVDRCEDWEAKDCIKRITAFEVDLVSDFVDCRLKELSDVGISLDRGPQETNSNYPLLEESL